jgi:hypothetical protein
MLMMARKDRKLRICNSVACDMLTFSQVRESKMIK